MPVLIEKANLSPNHNVVKVQSKPIILAESAAVSLSVADSLPISEVQAIPKTLYQLLSGLQPW